MGQTNVIVLGAGPAGLSAAIALSMISTLEDPIKITVLELRPDPQTIGGAVNLTPLALRYLDYLGAGSQLRRKGHPVASIDIVTLRNGSLLGSLWKGLDALRVSRHDIVSSLLTTAYDHHAERVEVRHGVKVVGIKSVLSPEGKPGMVLEIDRGESIRGDIVIGCDGLHSAARRLYVDPDRPEIYTGRVVAMGYVPVLRVGVGMEAEAEAEAEAGLCLFNSDTTLESTALFQGQRGSLLATFFEPTKKKVFLASVMAMAEPDGDLRDGWKLQGSDGESLKKDILGRYNCGSVHGLGEMVSRCDEWNLYPVYRLPPGGIWKRDSVLLLGDAAHAMPPQGESSAYAIEDAILLAHVFSRRSTRSMKRMLSDYELMRRGTINKHYKRAVWGFESSNADSSWLWALVMEYATMVYLMVTKWSHLNQCSGDVRKMELPD